MPKTDATRHRFPEYKQPDLKQIGEEMLAFWEQEKIFEKSISSRAADQSFVFYEGPPSANGMPGIHHVMSRTIKDLFCRFKSLQGYRVERKAGWDTHGLPVELGVEKKLGITKADIGTKITVAEYNRLCREEVMRYTDVWNDLTRKMGYWVDLENPYVTCERPYMENLWAILRKLYDKGLLYEGYTIQPYSPAAGTGLSSHELNQPGCYKNVKDLSAVAMFSACDQNLNGKLSSDLPLYLLAWTTTPWTLPSNTALAVGAEIEYAVVETTNPFTKEAIRVILASALLSRYFDPALEGMTAEENPESKQQVWKVVKRLQGSELKGTRYEQLLPFAKPEEGDAFMVLSGDFVTTSDGTGIVHIAPSFGADDFRLARENGIGALTLVDRQGRFSPEVSDEIFPLAGMYVKEAYYTEEEKQTSWLKQKELLAKAGIIAELRNFLSADELIVLKLKTENKLFKQEKYEHNYPHCWRTDKPVIYYPLDSWFIRTTAIKDRLIALNKTIRWKPAHTGEGRFGQWLENLVDWNLSRSRYWGTPLPIWKTEDGTEEKCIGSVAELQQAMQESVKAGVMPAPISLEDLHKPFVDEIVLVSSQGKPMHRVADLIDVWFDSGAMPYAQHPAPLQLEGTFPYPFPADFIAEGVDQTRGWFFTLHVLATALFDSVAFRNVVSNGLMLDKNGNKMSKRLGNVIDPFSTIRDYSADATRWYMIRNADPWENMKFDPAGVTEVIRSQFGTTINTYAFLALYANLDGWQPGSSAPAEKTEQDRWILSRLQTLIAETTAAFEDYEPTKACRLIESFTDNDLSNWYVRLNRRRFWKGEMSPDKEAAYQTLFECLLRLSQLMAPVAPFFSDWLYRNLSPALREAGTSAWPESVHLSILPSADLSLTDQMLERRMELAQRVCSLALSLRKKEKIKVRQPLQRILIPLQSVEMEEDFRAVEGYILNEVNIKSIEYLQGSSEMVKRQVKPNFRELGKKAGARMKAIQQAVSALNQEDIARLEIDEKLLIQPDGSDFELSLSDVEISYQDIPGWLVASEGNLSIALDIQISEELKMEGIAREVVNKIQNIRKELGFQVLDRIQIRMKHHPVLEAAILAHRENICQEVLANVLEFTDTLAGGNSAEINEEILELEVRLA